MAAVTVHRDFGAQENKICPCFHFVPFCLPWCDGTGCYLSFLYVSLSSFTFIKRLFSSSSLSAIRVVSFALSEVVDISPGNPDSIFSFIQDGISHDVLCTELNKHGDNIQPCHTPFPILNQSVAPCSVLTVASWPTYRFVSQETSKVVWYSHFFKNFPLFVVIHTVKGFSVVNEEDFWNSLTFLWSTGYWQFDLWFLCLP